MLSKRVLRIAAGKLELCPFNSICLTFFFLISCNISIAWFIYLFMYLFLLKKWMLFLVHFHIGRWVLNVVIKYVQQCNNAKVGVKCTLQCGWGLKPLTCDHDMENFYHASPVIWGIGLSLIATAYYNYFILNMSSQYIFCKNAIQWNSWSFCENS